MKLLVYTKRISGSKNVLNNIARQLQVLKNVLIVGLLQFARQLDTTNYDNEAICVNK